MFTSDLANLRGKVGSGLLPDNSFYSMLNKLLLWRKALQMEANAH